MTLAQFVQVLKRRRWWVALLTLLGIVAGGAVGFLSTPSYTADASVFVSVNSGGTVADLSQGSTFSTARVASYAQLATSPSVLTAAAKTAHVRADRDDLQRAVRATSATDTVILTISATLSDPDRAAALADAVAETTIARVESIEKTDAAGEALVKLSVYQEAAPPTEPSSPNLPVDLALGLVVGLGLGIAVALLRDSIDTKVRSVEELRRLTGRSVLAEVPVSPEARSLAPSDDTGGYSELGEAFRQLRTHLTFTNLEGGSQVVVVTSAAPGEGKSSTAINLADKLAENGSRTLLIDADLRRPSTSNVLGIESRVGLSTVLTHQLELEDAIQVVGTSGLHVLAPGRVPPNPSELLSSRQMSLLLETCAERYDHVVIDAPPVLPVTDPAILAAHASGVVFVSSVDGRARRGEVVRALDTLESVGARVLGIVANRVKNGRRPSGYYASYEAVTPVSESPRRARRASVERGTR